MSEAAPSRRSIMIGLVAVAIAPALPEISLVPFKQDLTFGGLIDTTWDERLDQWAVERGLRRVWSGDHELWEIWVKPNSELRE